MPTPSLEKAAAVAELSKKHGGLFVFATRSAKLLSHENASAEIAKHKFAEHACSDCGTHFEMVTAGAMQPFCVTCGSEHVKVLSEVKPKVPRDSELASVSCSCCGTKTIIRPELASAAGSIHCTACGTAMNLKTTADVEIEGIDNPVVDADDLDLIDLEEDPIGEEVAEKTQDNPETKPASLTPDLVAPALTTQETNEEVVPAPLPADPVAPATSLQDPAPVVSDAEGEGFDDGDFESIDVDMVDELDGDNEVELSFVHIGKNVHLVGNQQIVATLTDASAGENASIMHTEEFRRAVAHSIGSLGLKKTVAQYGFKPSTISVKVDKTFAKKVEASVQKKAKELSAAQGEVFEDVSHCIDIAAAGFAGNFWRNKADPLKIALANELKAVGVKNSTQFVDRVFASQGIAHLRQVTELAKELIKKPPEARNALAQAIDLAKYQPMVVKASDESEDEDLDEDMEGEEDDVLAVAHSISEPVVASASNSKSPYRSPALASILGGGNLPFSQ